MVEQPKPPAKKNQDIKDALWLSVQLVWDMGWIISLPVVVLGFAGAYVDRYYGTSPLFILSGFLFAAIASSIGVKRKLKRILEKRFP